MVDFLINLSSQIIPVKLCLHDRQINPLLKILAATTYMYPVLVPVVYRIQTNIFINSIFVYLQTIFFLFRQRISIFFLTNGKQNSWNNQQHFVLVVKISRKNLLKKMENNLTLEKILWVFNRNAELLRLVGATFYSKVASLRRMMKKNLNILKSLQKRKLLLLAIFCFILSFCHCLHLSCQISIESVRNNIYMLTEHSAVFEIFLNITTIYLLLNNN